MWLVYLHKMLLLENVFLEWKKMVFNKPLKLTEDNLVILGLVGMKRLRSDSMDTCPPSPKKIR